MKARLNEVVDNTINRGEFQKLIEENALTDDVMDVRTVMTIKEDMERMEAHKLQPHFIEAFFLEAFQSVGGKIRRRTVSKNEILTALNKPEEFILAIVEVDSAKTHTVYLKHPFRNVPDFTATSVNYDMQELIAESEILYQQ